MLKTLKKVGEAIGLVAPLPVPVHLRRMAIGAGLTGESLGELRRQAAELLATRPAAIETQREKSRAAEEIRKTVVSGEKWPGAYEAATHESHAAAMHVARINNAENFLRNSADGNLYDRWMDADRTLRKQCEERKLLQDENKIIGDRITELKQRVEDLPAPSVTDSDGSQAQQISTDRRLLEGELRRKQFSFDENSRDLKALAKSIPALEAEYKKLSAEILIP